MSEWITPVFDRTYDDVYFAITKLAEWKEKGSIDVYELKGCLNVSDINRIENNVKFLSDELSKLYYFPHTTTDYWWEDSLPKINDINRIIGNVKKIISAYYQIQGTPSVPDTMLTYEHINSIEENLMNVYTILNDMKDNFRECDTFECGEE